MTLSAEFTVFIKKETLVLKSFKFKSLQPAEIKSKMPEDVNTGLLLTGTFYKKMIQ